MVLVTLPFHWHGSLILFFSYFVHGKLEYRWTSRTLPCDVTENKNNSDIIFNCSERHLTEVPQGISANATKVLLLENSIRNVSVQSFFNLQNLTLINLNWNGKDKEVSIADRTFSRLTNLQELHLDGNGLWRIPKWLPLALKLLSVRKNSIISVRRNYFSELDNLEEIYLDKNCYFWNPCNKSYHIDNGSFANLTQLRILSLTYNNLTTVPKNLPHSLEDLYLGSNQIQRVNEHDFSSLPGLQILDLSGNCPRCHNAPFPCVPCPNHSIEIHPLAFHNLTHLQELHLSGNSLRSLPSSWFDSLQNLQQLFLSFNFLTSAIAEGNFLDNLAQLKKIDLSYNYNFKAYPETLTLSPNFSKLESLKTFHIAGYVFQKVCERDLSPLFNLKNLSVLNLGTNFITSTKLSVFQKFENLKLVYLSENRLAPAPHLNDMINGPNTGLRWKPPNLGYRLSKEKEFDYELSHLLVKHECFVYGKVLDLSSNNIFFIYPEQFEGNGNISCLNLSKNGLATAFNGSEFTHLPRLKYLDLSFNKIDLAYDAAFSELKELEVLDISFNPHYFSVSGVTHNLGFLKHLEFLKVLNLSQNNIFTLTNKELSSKSLKELHFQNNQLHVLWKENDHSYWGIFKNLLNLLHLDISNNKLKTIPSGVYSHLPQNLTTFILSKNELISFDWKKLKHFKHLKVLNLGGNKLSCVTAHLSNYSKTLELLVLSNNYIARLTGGFLQGAKYLFYLDLSYNKMKIINESDLFTGPDSNLKTFSLKGNPFDCTCDILDLILWIKNNDIDIPLLASDVTCAMPADRKGKSIITFDLKECVDDSIAAIISFLTSFLILCTMAVAVMMHVFYWDVWYLYHFSKAKIKGYRYLASTDNIYNAFITYDTKDPVVTDWVFNHLRVQLEEKGEKFLPICLEERDWHPGAPVIDNLSQSIRQSRKTVFVLTERYVNSGNFRLAFYLAHQRLLDDNTDVIVLVLLEPVLQYSQFFRLRKRLCRKTILEWPKNPHAEDWFWQSLRNVIRLENQAMYNKLYTSYFASR
ncbi:toll-like receptor 8 [Amia ocellicauda]|uniref:toll-like receptor 8 n=1 Tax=Amia ocellicauda TaxID=2972642 RepID=UPI0034640961